MTLARTYHKVFGGLTAFEKVWLAVFSAVILIATIYFSLSGTDWKSWWSIAINWLVSPISALTGVVCVLLVARASIYNYSFGLVQSILYGLISWLSGYYGDWILNWFFFVPTQFLIFLSWRGKLQQGSHEIVRLFPLKWWQALAIVVASLGALVGFGFALHLLDNWFINDMKRNVSIYANITKVFGAKLLGPMMDSSTEVLQIAAQVLCITRSRLQWPMWIATNVITIAMWAAVALTDHSQLPLAMPTLVMWIAFLFNSIYGAVNWSSAK